MRNIILLGCVSTLASLISCSTTEKADKPERIVISFGSNSNPKADSVYVATQVMPKLIGSRREFHRHVEYPKRCRVMRSEGTVIVSFNVTENGETEDFEIVQGIHPACNEAAIQALKRYAKFTPGTINGKPIEVNMTFPIVFRLR